MRNILVSLCALLTSFAVAKRGDGDQKLFFKGTEFPEVSFAAKHKDLVLECEVGGAPTPTIHWLKNGERIQQVIINIVIVTKRQFLIIINTGWLKM